MTACLFRKTFEAIGSSRRQALSDRRYSEQTKLKSENIGSKSAEFIRILLLHSPTPAGDKVPILKIRRCSVHLRDSVLPW